MKDPRFSVTAPAWQGQGVKFEKVVVCLREPRDVAQSLRRRNGITVGLGLKLWEEHFRRNLALIEGPAPLVVPISSTCSIRRPVSANSPAAARFLGLDFDESRDRAWVRSIVRTRVGTRPAAGAGLSQVAGGDLDGRRFAAGMRARWPRAAARTANPAQDSSAAPGRRAAAPGPT